MRKIKLRELSEIRETKKEQKPFVVVGNTDIHAEDLMELYGLVIEECYFGEEKDFASYMATGKTIKLFDRPNKDYKEHLQKLLQESWDAAGQQEIKKARKKTKFKTDVPWAKALKKKGKL